jgi:CRISPR-associated protein Cmr6
MKPSANSWEKPKLKKHTRSNSSENIQQNNQVSTETETPSPWLDHPYSPKEAAEYAKHAEYHPSFVEYLRWMRIQSDDDTINNGTILEIFKEFQNNDFSKNLNRLTDRTKRLSERGFKVTCPWRIRVGGVKGPESMLLPAFDNLGIPYIPSSTLKGVARAIAQKDTDWTEEQIKTIFGDINPEAKMGLVTFLDAYPLPGENKQGGLKSDIANSIWKWKGTIPPDYNTNPNTFVSLCQPTFIIGLSRNHSCSEDIFNQVIAWLKRGLGYGIGSRVNTGYGILDTENEKNKRRSRILAVPFHLKGQLIHGGQKFEKWSFKNGKWRSPSKVSAEVRPTAFRSILRYWFRALVLGILSDNEEVRNLELEIFGDIEPKPSTGLFSLEITNYTYKERTKQDDKYSTAEGELILRHSSQTANLSENKKLALEQLLQNLTWLMFHLGGVGQGARRPCYSRQSRSKPPWWRGATLTVKSSNDEFWNRPNSLNNLSQIFQLRLQDFYRGLQQFRQAGTIDYNHPRSILEPTPETWAEIIDRHCRIICVTGEKENHKHFALAKLHEMNYKGEKYHEYLCGSSKSKPSPIWIAEVGKIQVVTIFGITDDTENPRTQYLDKLQENPVNIAQIWCI